MEALMFLAKHHISKKKFKEAHECAERLSEFGSTARDEANRLIREINS